MNGGGVHKGGVLVRVCSVLLSLAMPAAGATFTVTTGADSADGRCDAHCSLREAITLANTVGGPDRIALPGGTVTLSIAGSNENGNARGDLDVTGELVIAGAGAERTVIDAQRLDRVLHGVNAILTLEDLTLRRGRLRGDSGGCVALQGGALTLHRVVVRDCGTDFWGGGLYAGGAHLTVIDSTLSDNDALRGGGLYYQGFTRQLTIASSTISGNHAEAGGGVFIDQECGFATPCAIASSTIAANTGGGLENAAGRAALTIGAVLFADNQGGSCARGSARSLGHNLDDDGSCPLTGPGDRPRARAGLLALRDTGGPTLTHALADDSAAVDGGDPTICPALDQRGQPRLGNCDIGAHEATLGDCGDGVLDRGETCDTVDPCCVGCLAVADDSLCADDGDLCTADRCAAGLCRHPAASAGACRSARRDRLALSGAGALRWEWSRGAPNSAGELGVPAGTSALCLYDGDEPELLASLVVPAGAAQWRAAGDGFQHSGARLRVALIGGGQGRARIAAQAGGVVLPHDVVAPLRVEWRTVTGHCWASRFAGADIVRDDGQRLVARRRE